MTVKDLRNMLKDAKSERQRLTDSIPEMEKEIAETKAEMTAAGAGNQFEKYRQLNSKLRELEEYLTAAKGYLTVAKEPTLDSAVVSGVWESICTQYNADVDADIKKYNELREKLFTLFCGLYNKYNAVLAQRSELAAMIDPRATDELSYPNNIPHYIIKWQTPNKPKYAKGEYSRELNGRNINEFAISRVLLDDVAVTEFKL